MFILCLDCDQCRVCAFLLGAGSFLKFHLTKTFDDPEKINRPTAQSWKCYPPPPKTSMAKGDPPFEDVFPS